VLQVANADGIILPAALSLPALKGVSPPLLGFQQAFFGRMLFSCLVDADFLETERFYVELGEIAVERPRRSPVPDLRAAFDDYLAREIAP
jgi:CRISPR-associated endonuclease/helicase Cas3